MVVEYKPQPLVPYMASLGIPYWLESDCLVERARLSMQKNSICSFCSRMKRGMIYTCARRNGYNVIAMGQHLDDLAESFVMSSFHNGQLRTMKANYTIDKGDLRVIRPLVTCRERLFKEFSDQARLPVISDNCPACFSAPKERHRIKLMLA
jgi:tRNA 2-thiocytidine biosynthesis protein TtcA